MGRHSLRSPGRLALFAVALLPLARAESPVSVCEPAPEVNSALRELWTPPKPTGAAITPAGTVTLASGGNYVEERLSKLTALLERFPDDFFVHRERVWLLRTLPPKTKEASIAEYRALADQHPEHPGYPYLSAKLMVGLDTPAAIATLEQALQRNPGFPWPHLGLVEIYGFPNFQNDPKAIKHIEAFIDACPEVVEGYGELRRFETSTELASNAAKKLRKLLESSDDPRAVLNYTSLWALEFKAPRAEHDRLRERVRDDVTKIEKLNRKDDFMWHMTVREGYTLIGDKKGSEQIEQQMSAHFAGPMQEFVKVQRGWHEANKQPVPGAPLEDWQAHFRNLYEASGEWVKKWPGQFVAWHQLVRALTYLEETSLDEATEAAEQCLKAAANVPGAGMQLSVAELYVRRGVLVERVPELVEETLTALERPAGGRSDLYSDEAGESRRQLAIDSTRVQAWSVLVRAYEHMGKAEKIRPILVEMEDLLLRQSPDESDQLATHNVATWRSWFWEGKARFAEMEGRKLDAVTFYQNALRARPGGRLGLSSLRERELTDRARDLWAKLGGTEEGWQGRSWQPEGPEFSFDRTGGPWRELSKALPEFELTDLAGKTWKLADLKGKATFVNFWTTWCGPCRVELPYLQKLYEKTMDRDDLLVLTMSHDDNLALAESYVKGEGYTFPVIHDRTLAQKTRGVVGYPTNWIVDPAATLRLEHAGFGEGSDEWVDQMIAKMEGVLSAE